MYIQQAFLLFDIIFNKPVTCTIQQFQRLYSHWVM